MPNEPATDQSNLLEKLRSEMKRISDVAFYHQKRVEFLSEMADKKQLAGNIYNRLNPE